MQAENKKGVMSPLLDFMLLGGMSLVLLPLAVIAFPGQMIEARGWLPWIIAAMVYLEYVANFPHFIYSYQLLYNKFPQKIAGSLDPALQYRYIFAGILMPLVILAVFGVAYLQNDVAFLRALPNILFLTAGWHYAKQGFGILIVTSVSQKVFYSLWERRLLLANAHLMWMYAWVMFNTGAVVKTYFGIQFYTLGFPPVLQAFLGALALLGAISLLIFFAYRFYKGSPPPLTGITAYVATIYLWIILRFGFGFDRPLHPAILFIPFFHSIQYMAIVMKVKVNQAVRQHISGNEFIGFIVFGIVIGALVFEVVPNLLDAQVPYDKAIYGLFFFKFMVWTFINIHHYFIDNVIWRRESSGASQYLFS